MVYGEETVPIAFGLGLNLHDHPVNLEDGLCQDVQNMIAYGDRLVSRKGFKSIGLNTGTGSGLYELNNQFYTRFPNTSIDTTWPAGMWYANGSTYAIRQFNRENPSTISGTGISRFQNGGIDFIFKGGCSYLNKLYINTGSGVFTVSSINWTTGQLTLTTVAGSPTGTRGLFVFKDRMWCWDDSKIYYTDAVSSPGGFPETWGSNFIVLSAASGLGKIYNIIPSGTKLYVFTASGLYNVSILGSPANWVARFLQDSVSVNNASCAIEYNGLIFFVDVNGVWATDGSEINYLSKAIEPIFNQAPEDSTQYYTYKIMPFEDGFILIRQTVGVATGLPFISPHSRIFYTRFEDILWTEWNINNPANVGIVDIYASFSKMETWNNWNKNSYLAIGHSDRDVSEPASSSQDLCIYQGSTDELNSSTAAYVVNSNVGISLKTKIVRASFINNKRSLYAYLNLSMADDGTTPISAFNGSYTWNTEEGDAVVTGLYETEFLSTKEGLIKFTGPEQWRFVEFETTIELSGGIKELTLLNAVLINTSHRKELRGES